MPLFSRFKSKGAQPTSKGRHQANGANGNLAPPKPARWQSRWESTTIVPDEVAELVRVCTAEMKSRAEALDAPFLLLPFRPESDPQGARTFVRNYYKSNAEASSQYNGDGLRQELRLTDSVVLCSILKWCWSRMPNGVVSWPVYDGFRIGEREANLARNAFDTFIPIGVDSDARRSIIFDFFDLLAAVAAHGKLNGLTGRKLSRLAGWWAFDHSDDGKGFEGGYRSWSAAADASSHLFFAYLRSLSPDTDPSLNVIERIPRSLQALVASTEYPPETPTLLQRSTPRVVMMVDSVSPTPFALLRRAKHFEYRDQDRVLREYQEFEDPVDALTDECKRVLLAVSSANQSATARSRHGLAKPDESWTAFSSLGFADIDVAQKSPTGATDATRTVGHGLRDQPRSRNADAGRPTTPSWADFLSSGFADDGSAKSPTLLYPPVHVLPPLGSRSSSPGPLPGEDETIAPGELAAITNIELDDAFWWVWMISLAGEEPIERKGVFGRCALVETTIMNGHWLIMEEQVKGASPDPAEGAYIAPKKSFFSTFTKRGRLGRNRSTSRNTLGGQPERLLSATPSKTSISTDREAKIKAAARALTQKAVTPEPDTSRRGRTDDGTTAKTNSTLTIGLQSEATPAMKWASAYDKNTIRAQYLGDAYAGKGMSREELVRKASANDLSEATNGANNIKDRDLPATPKEPTLEAPVDFAETWKADASPAPQQATSALDKELGPDPGASPESVKVGRKPVPRSVDHPALRQIMSNDEQPRSPASPTQNAAALAAARAMQSTMSTSPESVKSQSKLRKQPSNTSGIKKLFGKRKDQGGRDSVDGQRPNANGLSAPADNSVSRRISVMRKKAGHSASPRASEPTLPEPMSQEPEFVAQEPVVTAANVHDHQSNADLSRPSTVDRQAAEHEFARFDQGPMDDMPAAMPASSPEASPEPNLYAFEPSRLQAEDQPSFDRPVSHAESEVTMEDHRDAQVVQDRWATIRDNANRRAANHQQNASEDQSTIDRRMSHSQRTDDGETSGEETIESRVARIKARVAELTGNMDAARA